MLQIADAVEEIVYQSDVAVSAMAGGYMNFSAFAKKIKPEVEARTKKEVKIGSIVAALARLAWEIIDRPLEVKVEIENLTVKSPLSELSYDKTEQTLKMIKGIRVGAGEFLTVTLGTDEITVICSPKARKEFSLRPKFEISGLLALSIRFGEKYIDQPNVIYSLIRRLAVKRINILEVVSTYTELTFLIRQADLQKVMGEFS